MLFFRNEQKEIGGICFLDLPINWKLSNEATHDILDGYHSHPKRCTHRWTQCKSNVGEWFKKLRHKCIKVF